MKQQKNRANYDYFIRANTTKYEGEWVAICGAKIISHGDNAEEVYKEAKKKHPKAKVSLAKVPNKSLHVLALFP